MVNQLVLHVRDDMMENIMEVELQSLLDYEKFIKLTKGEWYYEYSYEKKLLDNNSFFVHDRYHFYESLINKVIYLLMSPKDFCPLVVIYTDNFIVTKYINNMLYEEYNRIKKLYQECWIPEAIIKRDGFLATRNYGRVMFTSDVIHLRGISANHLFIVTSNRDISVVNEVYSQLLPSFHNAINKHISIVI